MTQSSAAIHTLFDRIDSAVSLIEEAEKAARTPSAVEEENARISDENEALSRENARLSNELQQLQQDYLHLQTAANQVANKIDGSIEQLDMLMEESA